MNPRETSNRRSIMSNIKAEEILPKELLETIQQYVDGQLIYIPCKETKKSIQRILRDQRLVAVLCTESR